MTDSWIAIQRNPRSGSGRRNRNLHQLISELRRRGIRTRLFRSRDRLNQILQAPEERQRLRCIIAAGGDGTVCDVINRFPDVPVFPFPLGTENLLCRHYGINGNPKQAADHIESGQQQPIDTGLIDTGLIDNRRFLLMASAGFDAHVIHELHRSRTGHISRWSYTRPIVAAATGYGFPQLRVFVDNRDEPITGCLVVIANLPVYAFGLPLVPEANPSDGLLSVRVFPAAGTGSLLRYCCLLPGHRHLKRPDIPFLHGRSIRIESDVPVPVQIDGDPCETTPCTIRVAPAAGQLLLASG